MSTTVTIGGVEVGAGDVDAAVALGRELAAAWEARFSRFRPDSALSRLNAAGGRAIEVDETFLDLLATMRAAVLATEGRFDPSVLPAMVAAGYRDSIERVQVATVTAEAPRPAAGVAAWREVRIDRTNGEVTLPPGMQLDAGGIAKGAFVDALAERLAHWPGGWVDAGGDIRVWGETPTGEPWSIGIEHPAQPGHDLAAIRIDPRSLGGIATSAPNRRRWHTARGPMHHLIDPALGRPLAGGLASVTAFAPTVTQAEIATKAIMIAAARGLPLEPAGATIAAGVDHDGRLTFIEGFAS